jgi:hypothetical protein
MMLAKLPGGMEKPAPAEILVRGQEAIDVAMQQVPTETWGAFERRLDLGQCRQTSVWTVQVICQHFSF